MIELVTILGTTLFLAIIVAVLMDWWENGF